MAQVKFRQKCRNCTYDTGCHHVILWYDEEELQMDGEYISEFELIDKINDWFLETNYKCANCGMSGEFSVWDAYVSNSERF